MESLTIDTPVGPFTVTARGEEIVSSSFGGAAGKKTARPKGVLAQAREELLEYFRGERKTFTVPLAVKGARFEMLVWRACAQIPYGRSLAYSELAATIKRPAAARAVGSALGRNPLPLFIPCHRVVPKGGGVGGFGAGPKIKAALLDLERGVAPFRL